MVPLGRFKSDRGIAVNPMLALNVKRCIWYCDWVLVPLVTSNVYAYHARDALVASMLTASFCKLFSIDGSVSLSRTPESLTFSFVVGTETSSRRLLLGCERPASHQQVVGQVPWLVKEPITWLL